MRRAWLRGRGNLHKRYLIHVAGFNLGILMRALFGRGTPREAAGADNALLFFIQTDNALTIAIVAVIDGAPATLVIVRDIINKFSARTGLESRPMFGTRSAISAS
jgi:hypothetical protein